MINNRLYNPLFFINIDFLLIIRVDLTNEIICSIDPETAKDLDDALSIKHIKDDICNYINKNKNSIS